MFASWKPPACLSCPASFGLASGIVKMAPRHGGNKMTEIGRRSENGGAGPARSAVAAGNVRAEAGAQIVAFFHLDHADAVRLTLPTVSPISQLTIGT
jgi:hypothetical protein